jgi:hypothetical protein
MTASQSASLSSDDLSGKAIDLLRRGVFPCWWRFVPVHGKDTYVEGWQNRPLTAEICIEAYKAKQCYRGIGVVTGEHSQGLIALDVDGPLADERYKAIAGDQYEPYGEERTMAWTSGRPGRRQLLYQVPRQLIPELDKVTTLKLMLDGTWLRGSKAKEHAAGLEQKTLVEGDPEYEEVVLRFNKSQSVLPGSPHPDTGGRYHFLNYNHGNVEPAPGWVLDALRPFRKPVQWLPDSVQQELDAELGGQTVLPPRQIRGWFFKEEVQAKLRPRLADLVFRHEVFDRYGWKERGGDNPQMMSGCPWHGGKSGTSFQFSLQSGCWDCKACGIGGDLLDFIHKVKVNNLYASKPTGADLEKYVADLAGEIGFSYPEDARAQVTKEVPRVVMNARDFHEALIKIHDEEMNPALRVARMAELAAETGRRLTGSQCLAAMDEYRYYEDSRRQNEKKHWWQDVERMQFLVPNLLMKPTQVMLHAAGGLGKTSACMGLATAVGRGTPMRIRGIELPIKQGPVLWIQNDQNPAKLLQDCEDNGIDPARDVWFIVKRGFQINHTHEFAEWIRQYKPALVVVDSIGSCSTKMQVEEKDKGFASPFYYYAEKNGNPDDGFPATSIVWIHHDNANGEARGTRYLVAAVDEQWHLRTLSEDERESLRERRRSPSNCRMIQIKKSRLGRQGDLLVVERDHDFAYSVWDYTPTERREDQGQGDPEPNTMALRIVKDRVLKARGEDGDGNDRVTAKEVWERLVGEMGGQGRQAPSSKTVKRWLDRWISNGVLVEGKPVPISGQRRPAPSYTLPPTPSRALPIVDCLLSVHTRDRLQEQDLRTDTGAPEGAIVRSSEDLQPSQEMNGHRPNPEQHVRSRIPVPATDLGYERTTDNNTDIKEAFHGLREAFPGAAEAAPEVEEAVGEGRPLGETLPASPVTDFQVLGDGANTAMDGGSPADPDVGGPRSPVQRHDVDLPVLTEWRETPEEWAHFGDQW